MKIGKDTTVTLLIDKENDQPITIELSPIIHGIDATFEFASSHCCENSILRKESGGKGRAISGSAFGFLEVCL